MTNETYKGYVLAFAYSERHSRDVARRNRRLRVQPGRNWWVIDPETGQVLDSRLTRASARAAVDKLVKGA